MGRKVTIEPVTRIEGHARVTIHLDDAGKVEKAYFHVDQFRGFEKFCEGRMFFEMPAITPRICGICPVSHHLASAKACDALIGVQPPRPAQLLRELMHMGQIIQSHSMHFFHLASPDLLLGFDADPAIRNVVGIIQANPQLALKAVKLRAYGQEVIRVVSQRRIHPKFAVPGGVNKALTIEERDSLLAPLDEMQSYIQEGLEVAKQWTFANQDLVQRFANFSSGYMGLVKPQTGALELYDGQLRLVGRDGKLLEQFEGKDYLNYIAEHVEDWSYLKFPYYKKLGWPEGVYRVAPLARLNVADCISTPLAQEEFKPSLDNTAIRRAERRAQSCQPSSHDAMRQDPRFPNLFIIDHPLIQHKAVVGRSRHHINRYHRHLQCDHRRGRGRDRGASGRPDPPLQDGRERATNQGQPYRFHRPQ